MFIYICFVIIMLMLLVYYLFYMMSVKLKYSMESSSGYECGFNFLSKNRMTFSLRFFLIGVLFLIFDVEIVILLNIPYLEYSMMNMYMINMFIMILIMGLLYEYYCGSLEWMNYSYL